MATYRIGIGSFNLKDGAVGIGTESSGLGNLKVEGTYKVTDLDVTGVSTFTRYAGFAPDNLEIGKDSRDRTLTGEHQTTGDIVVGVNSTFTVSVGATVDVGTVPSVSIGTHFSPPTGGVEDRPEAVHEGMVRFNKDLNTLEFYNGVEWRQFTVSGSSGRGFYVGGFEPGIGHNEITYFNTSTRSNAVMFGDLQFNHYSTQSGCGNETRGLVQGTSEPAANDQKVDYFTMASSGNSQTFGELTAGRGYATGASSSTRGLCAGGYVSPANVNTIDYVEIMTLGDHVDFGDLSVIRNDAGGCSSPVRAVFIGGGSPAPSANSKVIDFVIIASTGNAVDFGGVFGTSIDSSTSHSNHTRAITAAGKSDGAYATELASGGNSFYFADLREPNRENCFNTGNLVRGVITGGYPAYRMEMEEVMIASGGRAIEFGEAAFPAANGSSFSDSHGGLGGY